MKILFISPRYSGGIGGHALRIAEKLRENGFDIELMHAPHIPIKKLKNPTFVITSILKAILNRKKYDVVHAFNIPSAFAMKYVNAKKRVLSVHGVYSEQIHSLHSGTTSSIVSQREHRILQMADKLLTNSINVQKTYKKKFRVNFDYIYGPIDIIKLKEITSNVSKVERQIVYIGRDSFEKGIDILKKIESKINANVVYCTNLDWKETMKILKSSDLLIVPSRIDNIPNVIKEALYLKIPIVGTDIEGISEIITNDVNGILVPPENPEKLIEAINDLLLDKEKAENLAEVGYEFVIKNFTWDVLLPKYKKFYEDLVNQ